MTLKEFLKTYSTVPNGFIDDFFSLYDMHTLQIDPVVDLDVVSKWLEVHKRTLVATLKASYKDQIDYKTMRSTRRTVGKKYGGNHYTKVLVTPDCFKRLCMLTRSPKGEQVRTYFIELESLIVRYNRQIIASIEADVRRLENNMRPRDPTDSAGYVYAIKAGEDLIKLGRSKDLNQRLDAYQTGRSDLVNVIFKYRTDNLKKVEACAHALLREQRYRGCRRRCKEVYKIHIDDIKRIVKGCGDLSDSLTLKLEYSRRKPLTAEGDFYMVLHSI